MRKKKKSNDPFDIGLLLPISEKGLKQIEAHDPELAKIIREKNPRWANQRQ